MSTGTALSAIIKQLTTILILLERPVVQQQLAALALSVALAWFFGKGCSYLEKRYVRRLRADSALKRWLPALGHLYFPILAIVLTESFIWFFREQAWPTGLLNNVLLLLGIWAAYGVLVTILYAIFEEKVELYHKRILSPLFAWLVAVGLINNLFDVNSLAQIQLGTLFNTPISLGGVISALIVFYIFLVATWVMQDFLVRVAMPRMNADAGVINSIVTVSRYLIITVGLFVAASSLGFDLSTLAFIGGGLTIALGFGLQQIVANFISGILLLFEQALRPGDVIKIDGQLGTVEKLRIRSTLVRTLDNVELIIPNEKLLTSTVTSYTKSERLIRISLPVGVGYDSNPDDVHSILLQTAKEHQLIRSDPAPVVFFSGLGDSSLDFQLLVWIDEPSQMAKVRSDLYFLIFRAFAKHHIEIPYPQHDLNLRRGWEKLAVNGAMQGLTA